MSDAIELLSEPSHWALLQRLQKEDNLHPQDLQQTNQHLRNSGIQPSVAVAITSQLALRHHAQTKFPDRAQEMLFTRTGLEQATRFQVAQLHAQRMVDCGIKSVADLGCGIGTESLAFAEAGLQVLALDRDSDSTICAATNLRNFEQTSVLHGDINLLEPSDLQAFDAIFLDPARRDERGRKFSPNDWSPSWTSIIGMGSWGQHLGAKIAPGIEYSYLPADYHTSWTSVDGQLVEAAIWSPGLSPEGPGRSAIIIEDGITHSFLPDSPFPANIAVKAAPTGELLDFLFEPDPAIIRSGLLSQLSEKTDTHLISPKIAYLSGTTNIESPFLTGFQVIDVLPLRLKNIKKRLRELEIGTVEVKKRGTDLDPNTLQRQLKSEAAGKAVLFATRLGADHRAIIAQRVSTE